MEDDFLKAYTSVSLWIGKNISSYVSGNIIDVGKLSITTCSRFSMLNFNHIRDIIALVYINILREKIMGKDKSWMNN